MQCFCWARSESGWLSGNFVLGRLGKSTPAQIRKATFRPRYPETRQAPKELEIKDIQEQLPVEEVFSSQNGSASEPISPPPTSPRGYRSSSGDGGRIVEQDSQFDDPRAKERRGTVALGMIGYDTEADEVWIQLINDPSLSENARSNLIEDLNEDGLSYPKSHPG